MAIFFYHIAKNCIDILFIILYEEIYLILRGRGLCITPFHSFI
jgi:hypothetical protein